VLRRIGRPCIVAVRVNAEDGRRYGEFGKVLRYRYLSRRGVPVDNRGEIERSVRVAIGPERIIAIHRLGDPMFDRLTRSRLGG
jgi:hypothetical protein